MIHNTANAMNTSIATSNRYVRRWAKLVASLIELGLLAVEAIVCAKAVNGLKETIEMIIFFMIFN